MKKIIQVGAGGIGSWLAEGLDRTFKPEQLVIWDGDVIEERNLDRQRFSPRDIGKYKAWALANQLSVRVVGHPEYLRTSSDIAQGEVIFVAVDNHVARCTALYHADKDNIPCVIAANEYEGCEAQYYRPVWKDGPLDPRVRFPEMLDDMSGDPLSPPCTGEEQEIHPQLAMANMGAASLAIWLAYAWEKFGTEDRELQDTLPVWVRRNAGNIVTVTRGENR